MFLLKVIMLFFVSFLPGMDLQGWEIWGETFSEKESTHQEKGSLFPETSLSPEKKELAPGDKEFQDFDKYCQLLSCASFIGLPWMLSNSVFESLKYWGRGGAPGEEFFKEICNYVSLLPYLAVDYVLTGVCFYKAVKCIQKEGIQKFRSRFTLFHWGACALSLCSIVNFPSYLIYLCRFV